MEESEILFDQQAEEQAKRLLAYYSCLRKQQKMSQSELERITGLSRTAINRCENGKLMPTIRSMNKLLAPLGYQLSIVPLVEADGSEKKWRNSRMRRTLMYSLIGLVGCTWLAGCQEKPEGAQTIIVELADPSDQQETEATNEEESQDVSELDTEAEETSSSTEIALDQNNMPQIIGFSDQVALSYAQISADDPIIGLMISNILPNVQAKDFEITDVQAYQNGAEVVPTEDITFQLNVDPEATVTLYRLNADGELVAEPLKVTDGMVSYQSTGCGRWLILDTLLETETEAVSESYMNGETENGSIEE